MIALLTFARQGEKMGSYAQLWLNDFFLSSTKHSVDPELIKLFRDTDKKIIQHPYNYEIPPQMKEYAFEDDQLAIVYYQTNVSDLRERMDVIGYTYETCLEAFKLCIDGYEDDFYNSKWVKSFTPKLWLKEIDEIRKTPNRSGAKSNPPETLRDFMTQYNRDGEFYGFNGPDMLVALRLILENARDYDTLLYDLTDVTWSGGYDLDQNIVFSEMELLAEQYNSNSKIVILTEGKSDSKILKESMQLLYPHLFDYYSFLEFETAGLEGGIVPLSKMVKSFAAAGIKNNIIALFDNDTAATEVCGKLAKSLLPNNIRVIQLPEIDCLKEYPSIGPSGKTLENINGKAASIELYLGNDVLHDGNELMPVQWTGFNEKLEQYQGAILRKSEIQKRFWNKLKRAKEVGAFASSESDWTNLKEVLRLIFRAFDNKNKDLLLRNIKEYYS